MAVTDHATPSTSPRSRRTSRSSSARSTASRSSTSTRPSSSQKPPRRARRDGRRTTRRPTPTCTAASTRIAEEATDRYEGARAKVRPLHRRPLDARGRLHQERHRGAQPRRPLVGPGQPARRRRGRCSPRWSTTPTSSRGSCCKEERGIELRCIPIGRRLPRSTSTDLDRLLDGAKLRRRHRHVQRARHAHPGAPARRRRPRRRRARASSTAPSTCPTCPPTSPRSGADFFGFTGHKMLRPHRHRRAVGPRGAARRHAAVPRRRRDDPRRPPRRLHAQRAPVEVRGRHAADRRGHRPRRAPSTTSSALGMDAVREHEVALTALRPAHAHRALRRRASRSTARPSRPSAAACSRSPSTTCTPTTSRQVLDQHGVCVRAGHHCAKPLMRVLGVGATARASFYVYNDEADVDALADALAAAADFFAF